MSAGLACVRHGFAAPLVPGRLIRRYKRFLADVRLADGRVVTAHCPNSGAMLTCLEEGARVCLSPQPAPGRRTGHTWEMIEIKGGWVGVNTAVPNHLAARCAELAAHPLFAGARAVRREVPVGTHTRLDLVAQLPGGPLYVEVKNVTMVVAGEARFPDARTERGTKHLGVLMELKAAGARAAMLYVIQRSDARGFGPAGEIDPVYARRYHEARAAGVEVVALEAAVGPEGIRLNRELPLLGD